MICRPVLVLIGLSLHACFAQQARTLSATLQPFLGCRVAGGPELTQTTPLLNTHSTRTVQTMRGNAEVPLVDGARLTFAYPGSADFVAMKVEELEAKSFLQGKTDLISNFKRLISGDEFSFANEALPATMNGFQSLGQDHKELIGGMLGVYLFLDNTTHVAVTVYFPNADPARRSYSTMEQFAKLRDGFLAGYTSCVRAKLTAATR